VHAAEWGTAGVVDDGPGCAAGVGAAPRSWARAGPFTNKLSVATTASTAARRKKKCLCII
jgi:hypothetical protein